MIPQNDDDTCDVSGLKRDLVVAINDNEATFRRIHLYNCMLWIQQQILNLGGDIDLMNSSAGPGMTDGMVTIVDGLINGGSQ